MAPHLPPVDRGGGGSGLLPERCRVGARTGPQRSGLGHQMQDTRDERQETLRGGAPGARGVRGGGGAGGGRARGPDRNG